MNQRLALFTWLFIGLFALISFANAFLVLQNVTLQRAVLETEKKIGNGRQVQSSTQALVSELVVMGARHPTILPVLQKYGIPVPIQPNGVAPPQIKGSKSK